jgi:hypothetical protein
MTDQSIEDAERNLLIEALLECGIVFNGTQRDRLIVELAKLQASRQSSQSEPVDYEFCKLCNGVGKVGEPPIPCAWCRGKTRPSAHAQSEFLAAPQQAIPSGYAKQLIDAWDDLLEDLEMNGMHSFEPYIRSKAKFKALCASHTAPIESDK